MAREQPTTIAHLKDPGSPSPRPTTDLFSAMEWSTLVNRARATLGAMRSCREGGPTPCLCPVGGSCHREAGTEPAPCRRRYRATERRLAALAAAGPEGHRLQLRRTVDRLHLAYRELEKGGEIDD